MTRPGSMAYGRIMYTVLVEADFAAAHFLTHYHGKCERLHGHNYRVRLWARGETLDDGGMLVDFGSLKGVLREVVGKLDHQNLNDFKEFDGDPSAERIAKYLFDRVLQGFVDSGGNGELLWALDVYETPTNMARYERSGL